MPGNRFRKHRLSNLVETAVIMAALLGLLLFIAWLFAGTTGIVVVCVAGIPSLIISGARAGHLVLRMYRATPLTPRSAPPLTALVSELSQRAELSAVPQLYYIRSTAPLAFSVGLGRTGAIAVSHGLLHLLSWREIIGVVAHELSHIAGRDTRVMSVADVASRMVSAISFAGQMLLLFNLPLYLMGETTLPWIPLYVMMFAPLLMTLLQLALSRSREFEADLSAAQLTGDPLGLASALERMEKFQLQQVRRLFVPYGNVEVPSVLRTHPETARRIQRLVDLAHDWERESPVGPTIGDGADQILQGVEAPRGKPRRRISGIWY